MKTLKRIFLLTLVLLLGLVGFALAEASDTPVDEVLFPADLAALKETGTLFANILPGMSREEVAAAGLPVQTEPYDSARSKYQDQSSPWNRYYYLEDGQVVTLQGLRTKWTSLQFTDDKLICYDLSLEEAIPSEEIVALLSSVLGEVTEVRQSEDQKTRTDEWDLEIDGKLVSVSVLASEVEGKMLCKKVSVTYWDLFWDLIDFEPAE